METVPTEILFYKRDRAIYGWLSNFHLVELDIDGKKWASTEHYYQAQKAKSPEDQEAIRMAETPGQAKRFGQAIEMREDWAAIKEIAMLKALRAKFAPGTELGKKLLGTHPAKLHEDSPTDRYWGSLVGQNRLGCLLEQVREELIADLVKKAAGHPEQDDVHHIDPDSPGIRRRYGPGRRWLEG